MRTLRPRLLQRLLEACLRDVGAGMPALQLAAALEWSDAPHEGTLVTFDDWLHDAAQREGFITL